MSSPPDTVTVGEVPGTLVSALSPLSPTGSGARARESGESPVSPSELDSGVDARVSAESPVRPSDREALDSVAASGVSPRFASAA